MHLTDHLSAQLSFNTTGVEYTGDAVETNTTYAAAQKALWEALDPTSLYNSPNHAVAYVNLTTLFGADDAQTLINEISANKTALVNAYSTNAKVRAGYAAGYQAELDDIFPSAIGQAEILLSNTGTYGAYGDDIKTISIQAAIQHPLSRGSVLINTTSAFDAPLIDPGYLSHPADIKILIKAFQYARTVSETAPLSTYIQSELSPGSAVSTDAEWEAWIRKSVSTEYHPAGSASMLPEAEGGVVDTAMRVYGVTGLRVIDSSMVPIGMSAHMTAPLYGIAERAYELLVSTPIAAGGTVDDASTSTSTTTAAGSSSTKGSGSSTSSSPAATGSGDTSAASTLVSSLVGSSLLALILALAL